jgi:hypothetical protein
MDSAKANRIAITVVIGVIIAGTVLFLLFDQIHAKKESKVEVVNDTQPRLDLSGDLINGKKKRAAPAPEALPQVNLLHLDGTPLKLSDYSGKFVFLHIWSVNAPLSMQELNDLKPIYDKFLPDSRVVMIGVCAEGDAATIKRIAEGSRIGWMQAMAAPDAPAATKDFLASPGLLILGKDGSIIQRPQDAWEAFAMLFELLPRQKFPQPNALVIDFEQIPNQPTDSPQALPFQKIPPPSADDVATSAKVLVVDGRLHGQSGGPKVLVDGKLPRTNDTPPENMFFIAKSIEGRFLLDLTRPVNIKQINSYTWHAHERSTQIFRLYGADGQAANFDPSPKFGIDPAKAGWTMIADVNTNPAPWPRGISGISMHQKDAAKPLGSFRYLLFLAFPTQTHDAQGHTFFGEIDVIEAK